MLLDVRIRSGSCHVAQLPVIADVPATLQPDDRMSNRGAAGPPRAGSSTRVPRCSWHRPGGPATPHRFPSASQGRFPRSRLPGLARGRRPLRRGIRGFTSGARPHGTRFATATDTRISSRPSVEAKYVSKRAGRRKVVGIPEDIDIADLVECAVQSGAEYIEPAHAQLTALTCGCGGWGCGRWASRVSWCECWDAQVPRRPLGTTGGGRPGCRGVSVGTPRRRAGRWGATGGWGVWASRGSLRERWDAHAPGGERLGGALRGGPGERPVNAGPTGVGA